MRKTNTPANTPNTPVNTPNTPVAGSLLQELEEEIKKAKENLVSRALEQVQPRIVEANNLISELRNRGFIVSLNESGLVIDLPNTSRAPNTSRKKTLINRSWSKLYQLLITNNIKPVLSLKGVNLILCEDGMVEYNGEKLTPTKAVISVTSWPSANAWTSLKIAQIDRTCADWYDENT